MRIAVLHPGAMGVSVAQALRASGHDVAWLATDRSQATHKRAEGLASFDALETLVAQSEAIVSVCPPGAALDLAKSVALAGFSGIYLDANAVAPTTALQVAECFPGQYVDGGIIGPPAHRPGTTRMYLSGPKATTVSDWFNDKSALQVLAIPLEKTGKEPGQAKAQITAASSLKMAYAAFTKGQSALLLAVNALAKASGIEDTLYAEWALSQPDLFKRSERSAAGTANKAWRFVDEMAEISATFTAAGLPGQFHDGAGELYQHMSSLKDQTAPDLDSVLQAILASAAATRTD